MQCCQTPGCVSRFTHTCSCTTPFATIASCVHVHPWSWWVQITGLSEGKNNYHDVHLLLMARHHQLHLVRNDYAVIWANWCSSSLFAVWSEASPSLLRPAHIQEQNTFSIVELTTSQCHLLCAGSRGRCLLKQPYSSGSPGTAQSLRTAAPTVHASQLW